LYFSALAIGAPKSQVSISFWGKTSPNSLNL